MATCEMDLDGVSLIDSAERKVKEKPQFHKLYFNSLVSVEIVSKSETPVTTTRFDVVIRDQEDNLVFKSNGLLHDHYMTSTEAELSEISNYKEKKIALLMDDVKVMRKRFISSNLVEMFNEDVKFFYRLPMMKKCTKKKNRLTMSMFYQAKEAKEEAKKDTCGICMEDIDPGLMFSACVYYGHRYCLTCVISHIEVKLLDGMKPNCPQPLCKCQLSMARCGEILTEKLSLMWKQRIREDSIPYSQRVYCPYQRCSYLMSKTELSSSSAEYGRRRCFKCGGDFCIHCKVPWHSKLTCTKYKRLHTQNDDAELKSLANLREWRQCSNCQHMIERSSGCDHMTCRCGNSFNYTRGANGISLTGHRAFITRYNNQFGYSLTGHREFSSRFQSEKDTEIWWEYSDEMGRLFKIDLEGSVYKCKHCEVEFVVYGDPPITRNLMFQYPPSLGKLYCITKCYNVVIDADIMEFTVNGRVDKSMHPVFCIGCGSHVGMYYEGADDTVMYNEGNFFINRFKLHGPPEGSDDENPSNQEE
ncbi:IBR domain [Arabidopsis thaliana x Arabidopsis arenosa]|uniref:RBR-type E3 ubiquitin transferase n=1 Tax=Arabidopsis thaliana x Arabidopsis arenosa TaxID=1240361 RepID=A0A8T1XRK9_9BRAS|nr:IBR domain [Arabidopsis thaliana x Arabidopsis arenosa]